MPRVSFDFRGPADSQSDERQRRLQTAIATSFKKLEDWASLLDPVTRGTSIVDFGAAGATDASVFVAASGILSSSIVTASIPAKSTIDHSADEHVVESLRALAGGIVEGRGFYVYAVTGGPSPLYGKWSVAWEWS